MGRFHDRRHFVAAKRVPPMAGISPASLIPRDFFRLASKELPAPMSRVARLRNGSFPSDIFFKRSRSSYRRWPAIYRSAIATPTIARRRLAFYLRTTFAIMARRHTPAADKTAFSLMPDCAMRRHGAICFLSRCP